MKISNQILVLTLLALLSTSPYLKSIHADSANSVQISNLQVQPATIKVEDNFTITATLVNNSPNVISVHNNCLSPFSVTFDSHATVEVKKPCIYFAISKPMKIGENMTMTGPGSNIAYKAIADGVANATITFSYTIGNQSDSNMSFTGNPVSISKSILFTVLPKSAQTTPVIPDPLMQLKSGIMAKDVKCRQGLQLVFKSEDGSPACVKQDTLEKLVNRGWAKPVQS